MSDHARLSPSGSKKWMACPGSLTLEAFVPNESNEYSDDGTACHQVLEDCLLADIHAIEGFNTEAASFVGKQIAVNASHEPVRKIPFTEAMAEKTQTVIDAVLALVGPGGILTAEERVDFSDDIGVPGQFGTLDVCILRPALKELCIGDAKFGYKPVPVERNPQLMTYALAKYRQVEMAYDIETVRFWIFQPALRAEPFEWSCGIDELLAFAATLRSKACSVLVAEKEFWATPEAEHIQEEMQSGAAPNVCEVVDLEHLLLAHPSPRLKEWSTTFLNPTPNDEECAFCRVKAYCPSVRNALEQSMLANFSAVAEDVETAKEAVLAGPAAADSLTLNDLMKLTDLAESWAKAVRAELERRALQGEEFADWGLELGRAGARAWTDKEAAEEAMKVMRLKVEQMYDFTLISPTSAEKLAKAKKGETPVLGPRQWTKLQKLIGRADPKPSVKPKALIKNPYKPVQPDTAAFSAEPEDEDLS